MLNKCKSKKNFFITFMIMALLLNGCSDSGRTVDDNREKAKIKEIIVLPDGSTVNPDGTIKLAENSVTYGMYNSKGELIQAGERLVVNNDLIRGTVNFQQNIPGDEVEYMLIILVDYVQKEFCVQSEISNHYSFSLKEADEINIDIELPFPENAKMLTFLVIPEPYITDLNTETKEGRRNLAQTEGYCTVTCYLDENGIDELSFNKEIIEYNINNKTVFMTRDINKPKIMSTSQSGEEVKVIMNNEEENKKTYTMLAFLNWEQSMIDHKPYQLFELEAEKGYYYELKLPNVDKKSIYQVFMLENPFAPTIYDWNLSTMRTIIEP